MSSSPASAKLFDRLRIAIIGLGLAAIVGSAADTVSRLRENRTSAINQARFTAHTLLQSLHEHFLGSVQAADLVLQLAIDEMRRQMASDAVDAAQMQVTLRSLASRVPQVRTLAILGADGTVQFHSGDNKNPPFEVSHAPSLEHFREHPTIGFILGPPRRRLFGASTHFIPIERRIDDAEGRFAGVAVAAIDPDYFEEFYSRLRAETVGLLSIFSSRGELLAQIPNLPGVRERDFAELPLFREFLPHAASGVFYASADKFGDDRHVAYRRVDDTPYVISAAMPEALILATWRSDLHGSLIQLGFIAVFIAALTAFLVVATHRRDRLSAAFRASEAQFRDFADAGSDWYWEMGPDLRFTHFSGRLPRSNGAAALIGKTREEIADPAHRPANWDQHLNDLRHHRPFRDFTYRVLRQDGQGFRYCKISGKPIHDGLGNFIGYRGTGTDITQQVLAEQAAARAQLLLTEALEEVLEGFVLYDADDRLVMWNTRYTQLYPDMADVMVAGSRFEDLIRVAAARGTLRDAQGRLEEWIAERLANHRSPRSAHERQMADGRWIRVHECRLSDGGYVGVHTDITDTKRREVELNELVNRNALFAAVISTSASGVVITDPNLVDNPIIYVNSAFTALTGYTADEAIGRNPRFLRAPQADPATGEAIEAAWRDQRAIDVQVLNLRKDGSPFYADLRISPVRTPDGHVSHFVAIQNDVTARVLAEDALRERDEQIRAMTENLPGVVLQRVQRPDGSMHYTFMSERSVELSGYTPQEFMDDHDLIWRIVHPEDAPAYRESLRQSGENTSPADVEFRLTRRDGSHRWARAMFRPRQAPNGDVIWDGMVFDVTEKVLAEQAAARSRKLLEEALEATEEGFTIWDADDRLVLCNSHFRRLHDKIADLYVPGASFEDIVRAAVTRGAVPNARGREESLIAERLAAHRACKGAFESRLASGRWKRVKEYRMADGGTVGVHIDVTEQKMREIELGELARRNALFFAAVSRASSGVVIADAKMSGNPIIYVNPAFTALSGYNDDDAIGQSADFFYATDLAPDKTSALKEAIAKAQPIELRVPARHQDGRRVFVDLRVAPVEGRDGQLTHFVFVQNDVTAQVLAEEALRENEDRLRNLAANLPGIVFQRVTRPGKPPEYVYVSERCLEISGHTPEEWIQDPEIVKRQIAPEFHDRLREAIRAASRSFTPGEVEYRATTKSGEERWFRTMFRPRPLSDGAVMWDGIILDITAQKTMELQRVDLENQLRQSQKIEALGTLAGGIAHDVNNALVPIVALTKMTLKTLPEESTARNSLQTVLEASYRARDLVAQILAFSRKEKPKTDVLRLQDTVTKTMRLLTASLPPNISLAPRMGKDVPPVSADENQIVQVLMNLCTNAGHAIGTKTGQIEIGLDEIDINDKAGAHPSGLPAGRYARLTVTDTGCGMDPRTLQRIFEPFFTTKGVGEGTGLGLSVVHGIIANHGGRITAESEVGRGSVFTILLPLAEPSEAAAQRADEDSLLVMN